MGWPAAPHTTISYLSPAIWAWAASSGPLYSAVILCKHISTAQKADGWRSAALSFVMSSFCISLICELELIQMRCDEVVYTIVLELIGIFTVIGNL